MRRNSRLGTASEATLVALLAARSRVFKEEREKDPSLTLGRLLDRLIIYCSDQAHSSVDKAALIVGIRFRKIPTDEHCVMHGEELEAAVAEDRAKGLIPFFIVATLGTTPTVRTRRRIFVDRPIVSFRWCFSARSTI